MGLDDVRWGGGRVESEGEQGPGSEPQGRRAAGLLGCGGVETYRRRKVVSEAGEGRRVGGTLEVRGGRKGGTSMTMAQGLRRTAIVQWGPEGRRSWVRCL